jgi:hypothetical protein
LRDRARILNEREKARRRSRGGEGQSEEDKVAVVVDRNAEEEEIVIDGVDGGEAAEEPGVAGVLVEMNVQGATASAQEATPLPTIIVVDCCHV